MLGPFAVDAYFPAFDALAMEFAVSLEQVQFTLSIYLFAFAMTSIFLGPLSDSFGRRTIVILCLFIFLMASLMAIFAKSLEMLILLRALQGMSGGAGTVLGQAIIRDKYEGQEAQKAFATITLIFGLAPALAPIWGGILQVNFGWRSIFVFLSLFTFVLLIFSYFFLDETLDKSNRHDFRPRIIIKNYIYVLSKPEFLFRCLAQTLAFGGIALYISSAPAFILKVLRLDETSFAWLFVPMFSGMMLGASFANYLATRLKQNTNIMLGFLIMAWACFANLVYYLNFDPKVPFATISIFLYAFGYTIAAPAISLKTLDLIPHIRGTASGVSSFLRMLFFALIAGAVAPLVFNSGVKLAITSLLSYALALVFWYGADLIKKKDNF